MKVLVATDGSANADSALDSIIDKPWPADTQFRVISVVESLHAKLDALFIGGLGEMSRKAQTAYSADLKNVLAESKAKLAAKYGQDAVSSEFLDGEPSEQIISAGRTWGADLIVLGGHNSSADGWYGCVRGVATHAPCSIQIVHPDSSGSLVKKEANHESPEITRLLISISTPADAELVATTVLNRSWPDQSRVQVLTVVAPFHENTRFAKTKDWQDVAEKVETAAKEQAEQLVATTAKKLEEKFGVKNVTYHVLQGNARSLILQVAQDWGSDLILMGAHSKDKTLLERLLGSTAASIVLNTTCSVELVKQK